MQSPPISQAEIGLRISEHLDELLELWAAEQGAAKQRDMELIALALPFPRDRPVRTLDLCCGPGDVGRAVRAKYSSARIDCVDRDPFLTSICIGVNRRLGIPGKTTVRDLLETDWHAGFSGGYDAVVTANALHWFNAERAGQLLTDAFQLLGSGGVLLFAEPASPEKPFKAGLVDWKAKQLPRYSRENWERFWSRANELLGYDHTELLGPREADRIGDVGMSVAGWIDLLDKAGFVSCDVLLRDADEVIVGAVKP
jgi:SAM-dependent methyltransferase